MAGPEANQGKGAEFRAPNHEFEAVKRWDFSFLQRRVGEIYEQHDEECGYTADTMATKLLSNAFTLNRIIERDPENIEDIERSLTNVIIWTVTLANYGRLDLHDPLSEKFSKGCPRCHQMPCNLAIGEKCIKDESTPWGNIPENPPLTIDQWQNHLLRLYPNNFQGTPQENLQETSSRLMFEIVELITSTEPSVQEEDNRLSQHDVAGSILEPWRGEFADVLAWGIAVGLALNGKAGHFSLEESLRTEYENGCPFCKSPQCQCRKDTTMLDQLHSAVTS